MTTQRPANDPTFGAWTRATWAGWVLGVPLVVLLALIGEALGIGGAQFLVGAGMGMGVGLLQARVLRGVIDRPVYWIWSCAVGIALPFAVSDILHAPYSLHACIAAGGFLGGVWQAMLLHPHLPAAKAAWCWIAASTLGWSLAGGTAAIADALQRGRSLPRNIWGALAYVSIVAMGGLVLGAVTAVPLTASAEHGRHHRYRQIEPR